MKNSIFIPKIINVGYQNRSGTYTGKLAYIIYYDEKGKLRKENSWNGWRDENILNDEFENVPTEGFVLNKKAGGDRYGWNPRQTYCRVYDPRGFEFEITIPNLLYILENTNCIKGKGLEGEFVYGWDGVDLVLMPVGSPDYKQIAAYNKIVHNNESIKARDLILGATYLTKNNEEWIYMGRFETYGYGYEWKENGEIKRSKRYKDIPTGRYNYTQISYKGVNNFPYGKMYWFARLSKGKYVEFYQLKTIPKNKLIGCINDKCTDKYSEIYDEMESSYQFSPIDDSKEKIVSITLKDFYNLAISPCDASKYIGFRFMANVNGKVCKYYANTSCSSEDNGKYKLFRYSNDIIYYGDIEELNIFPTEEMNTYFGWEKHMIPVSLETIYEKLKPVYKQKYLANGREYKKEWIFNEQER